MAPTLGTSVLERLGLKSLKGPFDENIANETSKLKTCCAPMRCEFGCQLISSLIHGLVQAPFDVYSMCASAWE